MDVIRNKKSLVWQGRHIKSVRTTVREAYALKKKIPCAAHAFKLSEQGLAQQYEHGYARPILIYQYFFDEPHIHSEVAGSFFDIAYDFWLRLV